MNEKTIINVIKNSIICNVVLTDQTKLLADPEIDLTINIGRVLFVGLSNRYGIAPKKAMDNLFLNYDQYNGLLKQFNNKFSIAYDLKNSGQKMPPSIKKFSELHGFTSRYCKRRIYNY